VIAIRRRDKTPPLPWIQRMLAHEPADLLGSARSRTGSVLMTCATTISSFEGVLKGSAGLKITRSPRDRRKAEIWLSLQEGLPLERIFPDLPERHGNNLT
jgi:hypothetical protein